MSRFNLWAEETKTEDSIHEQNQSNSQNLVIAINVMAYLTDKDLNTFFKEVNRVLKKGGSFLCLNGNELFDLFSLNNFTSDFFGLM